jgi:hypothetical protein
VYIWEHLTQDGTRFRGAGLLILISSQSRWAAIKQALNRDQDSTTY